MTITASFLMDLVLLGVLVYFFIIGVRKGLILSLCSLLAAFLGLIGGWYLAAFHSSPLQLWLEPIFATHLMTDFSGLAAKIILFLVGFIGLQLIWTLLCHVLDLVARLPGLHFINKTLGGILGLVKGMLIILIVLWILCDVLAWIPPQVAAGSRILYYLHFAPDPSRLIG